jgi:5-methylcytosine-specific restriction endonuclease McrA
MDTDSKHAKTSDHSRHLCDLMLQCLPQRLAPSRNFSATWCAAHIDSRNSALYWVSHSRKQIEVFLRCEDSPETFSIIQGKLPHGITLRQRPHPRKGIAISTPLFFFVQTEEQAQNMGPLLELLSSNEFAPKGAKRKPALPYWAPNSEMEVAEFEAKEEGHRVKISVNKYERDPKNRKSCIKHYGPICSACEFDFSVAYGLIGSGYIHVHHLNPLSANDGRALKINPIKDLRPVCPNCHEMLHRANPPYSIEQLKGFLAEAKVKS